jgi:DNA-binding transcriptional LysR family regulator
MDMLRLTLRQLQIFVAVARCGSTTAAGFDLALSQSATSSAVNELERLLSLKLFERSGKRLLLNDIGRALLPQALNLLDGAASIEQLVRDATTQAQTLRIGASTTIGNYVLPRLLSDFYGRPEIGFNAAWQSSVMIGNTDAVIQAVANFEIDVGLVEGPCHQPCLRVSPWLMDEMVLVCAPTYLPRPSGDGLKAQALSKKDLANAVWLLRENGSGTREAMDRALLPKLQSYRRAIELGSSEAIREAAAEGLGIACLSRWVVDDFIRADRLRCLATPLPKMPRQCSLVLHKDKQQTPALQRFVALAGALAREPKFSGI